ncbi:MAG: LCP family protein [Dorea sp.]|nr:LCP family protein [Dorea sp.]
MAGKKKFHRGRRNRKGIAGWSLGRKVAAVILGALICILVGAAGVGAMYVKSMYGNMQGEKLDVSALEVSEEVEHKTGYLNVAFFGVDTRKTNLGKGTRSDSIMVVSLDQATGKVKICSVYRDTLLCQEDGTYNKANAAYSFGGVEGAVSLLNRNLDLDITHYVTVNFNALVDVIDAVGGVEIDVEEDEVEYINFYLAETAKAAKEDHYEQVTEPGLQTLSGVQATSYCRIRYTVGDDYKRALRQRTVLGAIVEKLQNANLATITKIANEVYDEVATNFTMAEILQYAKDYKDYDLSETTGFPFGKTSYTLDGVGSSVIPATLESNVIKLHEFLYGEEENYTPSQKVKSISQAIQAQTGAGEMDESHPELAGKDPEELRKLNEQKKNDHQEEEIEVIVNDINKSEQ